MKIAIYQEHDNHQAYKYLQSYKNEFDLEIMTFNQINTLVTYLMTSDIDILYIDADYDKEIHILQIERMLKTIQKSFIIFLMSQTQKFFHDAFLIGSFQYFIDPIPEEFFKKELLRAIGKLKERAQKYVFPTTKGNFVIKAEEIFYLTTSYREYKLCTTRGIYYGSSRSILSIKKDMLESNFIKIERSVIINLKHVFEYDQSWISLTNGASFFVTKGNLKEFKEKLNHYCSIST